jgi:hypothetical protein
VQTVMASLGGFSKSIMVVLAVIAAGYARYKYQMIISNELYDFENRPRKQIYQSEMTPNRINRNDDQDEPEIRKESVSEEMTQEQKKSYEIKKYFDEHLNTRKRLKYNAWRYFKSLVCPCMRRNIDDYLAEKARTQVSQDIEIVQILQKLKEIDKLKLLMLTHYQREIFNFTPKPVIRSEEYDLVHAHGDKIDKMDIKSLDKAEEQDEQDYMNEVFHKVEHFDSLSKYGRLYRAYRYLKADTSVENQTFNRKLLHMLGDDLLAVFEKMDDEMGDNANPGKFEEIIQNNLKELSRGSWMSSS